jgi:hypothetical protein
MKVLVKIHQIVVTLNVEPSLTVGTVLLQALVSQNMEPQPDRRQRLLLGDAPLESLCTLADLDLEDGAELVFTDSSQETGSALLPAEMPLVESRDVTNATALLLQCIGGGAAVQPVDTSSGHTADVAADGALLPSLHSAKEPVDLASPPSPFLMQKFDPATRLNIRRAPSLEADVLCVVAGRGVYEFDRVEGEWAFMSPSERERLKATGESFVAHDTSVELCCRVVGKPLCDLFADGTPLFFVFDGKPLFERLNVEDMAAAVTAHRSLLALCASSSSWSSPSIVPALQALLDSDSPSAKAYACAAACSWCAAGVIAAKARALPLIHGAARLLCDSSAPFLQLHASACAWALALDLTLCHSDDAGGALIELMTLLFSSGDDGRTAAALNGLTASISTLERRSTLLKAGLWELMPLLREGHSVDACDTLLDSLKSLFSNGDDGCTAAALDGPTASITALERRSALIKAGLMPLLLEQLKRRDNRAVFLSALSVWSCICDRSSSKEVNPHQKEIIASGVLPLVAAAFDRPDVGVQHAASEVLWNLTRLAADELVAAGIFGKYFNHNDAHADVFQQLGTNPVILALIRHESAGMQLVACGAVIALCSDFHFDCESNRDAFVEYGIAESLVALLRRDVAEVQENALRVISMFIKQEHDFGMVINQENNFSRKDAFCSAGVAAAISQLLQSPVEMMQAKAAAAIGLFCDSQHVKSQHAFRKAGCVPLLVGLLSSSTADVQNWSSQAMLRLSEGHGANAAALCDAGAVGALAGVVSKGSGEARKQSCGAVIALCSDCESNCDDFVEGGIAEPLVALLRSHDAEVQENALRAILKVIKQKNGKDALCSAGAIPLMVQLLKSSDISKSSVFFCLWSLVRSDSKNQSAAAAEGAIPLMVQLAKSSDAVTQKKAVFALGHLVYDHSKNQSAAAAEGAIPLMVQLAQSSDANIQQAAVDTLGFLVRKHAKNQSAAAAEGAIPLMVQLTQSSDANIQQASVDTLGFLVRNHAKNQSNPAYLVANLDGYTPSPPSYRPAPCHAPLND